MEAKASEVRQSLKSIFLFYFNRFPNFPCYSQNMFKVNCNDSTEAVVTDVLQSIDFVKIYRKIPHATLNRLITNPSPMYLVRLEILFLQHFTQNTPSLLPSPMFVLQINIH